MDFPTVRENQTLAQYNGVFWRLGVDCGIIKIWFRGLTLSGKHDKVVSSGKIILETSCSNSTFLAFSS
jgi:hypothetical protein